MGCQPCNAHHPYLRKKTMGFIPKTLQNKMIFPILD